MGIFTDVLDLGKDILTLGGHTRLEFAKDRWQACVEAHERLVLSVDRSNTEIEKVVNRLKRAFLRTKRELSRADKMLAPLSHLLSTNAFTSQSPTQGICLSSFSSTETAGANASSLVVKGTAIGTCAAIAAWQGAQVVGVASTGTAMLGLHGVAASNAGWALFGGGSLASGGGGMALGHLVLPGLGLAVGVGYMAVSTHKKANELNRESVRVEAQNKEGEAALAAINKSLMRLQTSETIYDAADERLRASVQVARRRLRRFGLLSVLVRLVRFKWNGIYYTPQERGWALELDTEVKAFFSTVGFERI